MGETVSLAHGHIEVEERPGYLLMVEHGTLRTVEDVAQYAAAMEILVERSGIRRAVIDSRQADAGEPPKDVRDAMWRWLLSARAFDQIAFVLGNEMHLARVNMTALSQRANIKAFTAVHEAHRWLTGRQRSLSQVLPAATGLPPPRSESPPRTPLPPRTSAVPRTPAPPRTPTPPPRSPSSQDWPSFGAATPTPPPRRMSTPPPPADRPATRRTSEIAIPVPRLPDTSEPGVTRRTGQHAAARREPEPPRVPRSDVHAAITNDDDDGRKSDES